MDMYGEGTPNQRVARFDAMHGGADASVFDGAWFYFKDGAKREGNILGRLMEPSTDPRERYQTIRHYYKLKLKTMVRDFDTAKAEFLEHPENYPDHAENTAMLRELRAEIKDLQAGFDCMEEAIRRLRPGFETPEAEAETLRMDAAIAESKQKYIADIRAIQI